MVKQVWQASDTSIHDTQADAENHDMIIKVARTIYDAYIAHGGIKGGFKNTTFDETMRIADILVNTDVFRNVRDILNDTDTAELKQLRRIDRAARAWYSTRAPQTLDALAEALFDGNVNLRNV